MQKKAGKIFSWVILTVMLVIFLVPANVQAAKAENGLTFALTATELEEGQEVIGYLKVNAENITNGTVTITYKMFY